MTSSWYPATPVMASPAFHANIVTPMNQDHYRFKRNSNPYYPMETSEPVFKGILPNWLANWLLS